MKKLMIVVTMMAVMTGVHAQDAISKFFSKYQNDESFSQVTVSSKMFGLFTNMEAETQEDKEVLEAISKLKGLKILAKEDARNARELYKEAFSLIPMKDYGKGHATRSVSAGVALLHPELSRHQWAEVLRKHFDPAA